MRLEKEYFCEAEQVCKLVEALLNTGVERIVVNEHFYKHNGLPSGGFTLTATIKDDKAER